MQILTFPCSYEVSELSEHFTLSEKRLWVIAIVKFYVELPRALCAVSHAAYGAHDK